MPHLITNDDQKRKIAEGLRVEKQKQDLLDYVQRERDHIVYIEDRLLDPSNNIKQLGQPMTSADLEIRLRKIVPSNVVFIAHPFNRTKRAAVRIRAGQTETLVPYESGYMPEHSVLQLVEKEVPDIDVLSRKRSITRADLPAYEYKNGEFVFDESKPRPGFTKVKSLGREVTRGWRTILIRLILQNIITLADAEKWFGADNSPGWAQNLKHNQGYVPW